VIAYACTSGSFVGGVEGEQRLREAMLRAGAQAAVTTSGALVEALRALDVRRVAVGTPYVEAIGRRLVPFLERAGFEPVSCRRPPGIGRCSLQDEVLCEGYCCAA
jgi:maleate isomerase